MGSSSLFVHCPPCTTMPCPCIGQTYLQNSSSFNLFRFPRHLSSSGFEASILFGRKSGSRGASAAVLDRRSPECSSSSRPGHCGLLFGNQLLRCNVGIGDRTRRYVISTAWTKEREWQDYEDELQLRNLAGTVEFVDVLNSSKSVAGSLPAAGLNSSASTSGSLNDVDTARSLICPQIVDDSKILDACQMASDLTQVAKAYEWLLSKGFLPNFGKDKVKVGFHDDDACQFCLLTLTAFVGDRLVTEAILMDSIGLEASKLSPKKWGLSGKSAIALPIGIVLFSYLRDSGVDIRPIAALILALGFCDAIYLGGTGLVQIFSMWLPYKRRVLVHEAGHVLVAYLLGCPIRGVILDPMQALKVGIQGQVPLRSSVLLFNYSILTIPDLCNEKREELFARSRQDKTHFGHHSTVASIKILSGACTSSPFEYSLVEWRANKGPSLSATVRLAQCKAAQAGTQFWDQTLEIEFFQEGPAGLILDRYSIVLFAGVAAEALIYGEAQGGESDENLFKSVVGQLQPSWSLAKMSDHARWAVLQAFELLRDHKEAHVAVVRALEQEAGLGSLIRAIEKVIR